MLSIFGYISKSKISEAFVLDSFEKENEIGPSRSCRPQKKNKYQKKHDSKNITEIVFQRP